MRLASFLLRIGIAVTLLYAGVAALLTPADWIGFMPLFVRKLEIAPILLTTYSVFQLFLAVWLISGYKAWIPAGISATLFMAILIVDIKLIDLLFRDIGLLFAALALVALEKPASTLTQGTN